MDEFIAVLVDLIWLYSNISFFLEKSLQFVISSFKPKEDKQKQKKMFLLTVTTCMLAVLGSVRCEADSKPSVENGVLVLTQANFQAAIKEHEFILVEFCKYWIPFFHLVDCAKYNGNSE